MKQEFKRMKIAPILFIITGVIASINVMLQLALGRMGLAGTWSVGAILFFVNGIWSISTAYVIIDEGTIFINYALFKRSKYLLSDIESMDFASEKRVELYMKDKSNVMIPFNIMEKSEREEFVSCMKELDGQ